MSSINESTRISVNLNLDPLSPEEVIKQVALKKGPMDVYCWYEGEKGLPKMGADFMTKELLLPLHEKQPDAKVYLYSLRAYTYRNIREMPLSTPLGNSINLINKRAVECIFSSSFFKYCADLGGKEAIYTYLKEELPKKNWLFRISKDYSKKDLLVGTFFNDQPSLLETTYKLDFAEAYSTIQYVEGYYLVQESVKSGLSKDQSIINIVFLLPNDEGRYYKDFNEDIKNMLRLDFGDRLEGIEVNITFNLFNYGNGQTSKPYIDKRKSAPMVEPEAVISYLDFYIQRVPFPGYDFANLMAKR